MTLQHSPNLTKRFQDAVRLRDAALMKLYASGEFLAEKSLPQYQWAGNGLSMSHRLPVLCARWLPGGPDLSNALALKPVHNLEYGLEIWADDPGYKVLNIEWNRDGWVDLVGFRRGRWEQRVLANNSIVEVLAV